jgi:hypothetical protein
VPTERRQWPAQRFPPRPIRATRDGFRARLYHGRAEAPGVCASARNAAGSRVIRSGSNIASLTPLRAATASVTCEMLSIERQRDRNDPGAHDLGPCGWRDRVEGTLQYAGVKCGLTDTLWADGVRRGGWRWVASLTTLARVDLRIVPIFLSFGAIDADSRSFGVRKTRERRSTRLARRRGSRPWRSSQIENDVVARP